MQVNSRREGAAIAANDIEQGLDDFRLSEPRPLPAEEPVDPKRGFRGNYIENEHCFRAQ
jgi:hypothetical protein